jgi:phosphatidylserine/phosphatidylglycerophosphate/cardiolipin synthase-like enzyme
MKYTLALVALISAVGAYAKGPFLAERGSYRYSLQDIANEYQQKNLNYLIFRPERGDLTATYKITKKREYQIKKWFQQDWDKMQDIFAVDVPRYIEHFGGETFTEAKRRAFSELTFNKRKFIHNRLIPTPREWGGLNHPPIKTLEFPLTTFSPMHAPIDDTKLESAYFDPTLQREIDQVSKSELSFGNKLKLLEDRDAFNAKKEIIKNAKKTILMSSLVFVCDIGTRELVDLLIKRHKDGIDVRILVDATISKYLKHRECLITMKSAGIQVIEADDFWRYEGRTIYHTKNLVVDEKIAIAGGHNMIDADNLSVGTDFKNRDVDLKATGPMVTDMAHAFIIDWEHFVQKKKRPGITSLADKKAMLEERLKEERENGLRGAQNYPQILKDPNTRMKGVCRYIRQSPFEDGHSIGKAYLLMLPQVKNYLAFTNPIMADSQVTKLNRIFLPVFEYADRFVMYNKLWKEMQRLAKTGLRIDIMTTNIEMAGNENVAILNESIRERMEDGESIKANLDLFKIYLSNRFYGKPHYKNLLKDWMPHSNVHIWKHISFMHSKVMHFDRVAASVGSYNIQHNATDHSYEATAICQDTNLNKEIDHVLVEDMVNSIPLIFKK